MDKKTVDSICWSTNEKEGKFVHNTITSETGKVIECTGNHFDVETRSGRKYWPIEDCEPAEEYQTGSASKPAGKSKKPH